MLKFIKKINDIHVMWLVIFTILAGLFYFDNNTAYFKYITAMTAVFMVHTILNVASVLEYKKRGDCSLVTKINRAFTIVLIIEVLLCFVLLSALLYNTFFKY